MSYLTSNLRLWREVLTYSWRRFPGMTAFGVFSLVLSALATAVTGAAAREIVDGSMHGSNSQVWAGASAAALAYAAILVADEMGQSMRFVLAGKTAYEEFEYRNWRATMNLESIEHLERPEFLDRLMHLQNTHRSVIISAWYALDAVATTLRLALTLALLARVNLLLLLIPVLAIVPLAASQRGQAKVRRARTKHAEQNRVQRHYFGLLTSPISGKEIRVAGVGPELVHRQRAAADQDLAHQTSVQIKAMVWSALGWAAFSVAYILGLNEVVHGAGGISARIGDIVLTVVVALQLRSVIQSAVQKSDQTAAIGPALSAHHWLHDYFRSKQRELEPTAPVPPPERIIDGIVFEDVDFRYDPDGRKILDAVSFRLPAGTVCALVGEHGSGKSTIIKLLTKMYRPTAGRITVDGVDLAEIDTTRWRACTSAAFQDFGRYCVSAAENITIGGITDNATQPAYAADMRLATAIAAADAKTVIDQLPQGLDTLLGRRLGGVDLSEGQWQKLALARASYRTAPLLFVLDEPTASLDPPSEHAVFERYMSRAREIARTTGGVTVIVTHRFSTVAGADRILCMHDGRIVENGSHTELLGLGGHYAQFYTLQAQAYTSPYNCNP